MNKLYWALAGAALLALYTWWVYGLGMDSVETKVITITAKEDLRQTDASGKLAVGDAKHGQQLKEKIDESKQVRAPQDCDRTDIGDLRVDALGGVRH